MECLGREELWRICDKIVIRPLYRAYLQGLLNGVSPADVLQLKCSSLLVFFSCRGGCLTLLVFFYGFFQCVFEWMRCTSLWNSIWLNCDLFICFFPRNLNWREFKLRCRYECSFWTLNIYSVFNFFMVGSDKHWAYA